ncbi:hypothetical protein HNY73_020724 [Argiope bruennichi]|uniref:Reelin domain-containing protein n=2 Tax=Argiope bruennichi TaxID=94029 RepID=A0A8T0E7T4_ARGBR|nr:hypothetical protein HNY73_020724 [Argiope bruennichi]
MATMLWQPPTDRKRGEVLFMGTILESFSSYYSGQIATLRRMKNRKPQVDCNDFSSCANSTITRNKIT